MLFINYMAFALSFNSFLVIPNISQLLWRGNVRWSRSPWKVPDPYEGNLELLFREGIKKKNRLFLGNSPKQQTPPTHSLGLFPKKSRFFFTPSLIEMTVMWYTKENYETVQKVPQLATKSSQSWNIRKQNLWPYKIINVSLMYIGCNALKGWEMDLNQSRAVGGNILGPF